MTLIRSTLSSMPIYCVPVSYAKEREFEIGSDLKGLSLGWWDPGEEAPFSGMVYCLLK